MKETEFVAHFKYEGTAPDGHEKYLIENMFIGIYNEWCKLTNPMMAAWNSAYDGPDDGWTADGSFNPDGQYVKYMRAKYQTIVDDILNPLLTKHIEENNGDSRFKRFLIGEECNFEAELNDGTIMYFYLEEK